MQILFVALRMNRTLKPRTTNRSAFFPIQRRARDSRATPIKQYHTAAEATWRPGAARLSVLAEAPNMDSASQPRSKLILSAFVATQQLIPRGIYPATPRNDGPP